MRASDLPSQRVRIAAGLLFVGGGTVVSLAAFDIGPLDSSDVNGPPWRAFASGAIFLPGGVALWVGEAAGRHAWLSGTTVADACRNCGHRQLGRLRRRRMSREKKSPRIAAGAVPRESRGRGDGTSGILGARATAR